jgi:hypothetical protein
MEKAMKKRTRNLAILAGVAAFALAAGARANVAPRPEHAPLPEAASAADLLITDDTTASQRMSEIRIPRQGALDFDGEINALDRLEGRYGESLPQVKDHPRLRAPIARVTARKYRPAKTSYVAPRRTGRGPIKMNVYEAQRYLEQQRRERSSRR